MDGSAKEIVLDADGVCNFCYQAQKSLAEVELERHKLPEVIKKIKKDGLVKKYDCLIGLSGGIDSSTTLLKATELGLRPLCFSVDNGYNNPLADENMMRLVEGLKVPFIRYTIDLAKFKDLQSAFIKSGVPNIEIPTDHILMATTYKLANLYKIKWILSGGNVSTESVMPPSWGYNARDLRHIKAIYEQFTGKKLNGLPVCGLIKWNWYKHVKGIKILYILDYLEYNRDKSVKTLEEKFGWKNYYDKHCESYFTMWFQNYFLFEKYGIDKRKAHYSSLINSGQTTRKEAIDLLADRPEYPKLGIEKMIWRYPNRSHDDYPKDTWYDRISWFIKLWRF